MGGLKVLIDLQQHRAGWDLALSHYVCLLSSQWEQLYTNINPGINGLTLSPIQHKLGQVGQSYPLRVWMACQILTGFFLIFSLWVGCMEHHLLIFLFGKFPPATPTVSGPISKPLGSLFLLLFSFLMNEMYGIFHAGTILLCDMQCSRLIVYFCIYFFFLIIYRSKWTFQSFLWHILSLLIRVICNSFSTLMLCCVVCIW